MKNEEHQIQAGIVRWARLAAPQWLLYAIPNGGHRHIATAAKLKAEGVLAGVPDLFLPVARCGCHGLYLEVKTPKGRLSEAQATMVTELAFQDYRVRIVRSVDEGVREITEYLEGR